MFLWQNDRFAVTFQWMMSGSYLSEHVFILKYFCLLYDAIFTSFSFIGFKSQSSHSYKPIASSRQNLNSNRVAAKRNSTLSNKMSSHGMGTRSASSGTLNHAVSIVLQPKSHYLHDCALYSILHCYSNDWRFFSDISEWFGPRRT